jgi:hypothetical protein
MSQTNGATPIDNSAPRRALDNLLRRELRVNDPNDAKQIETALLARYKNSPRAQGIAREAEGLPFLQTVSTQPIAAPATTSNDLDLEQATSDINRDLEELTTSTILKDITPELQGWSTAIRSAIADGTAAARFAIDPRQRDKVFGIRRTLGDYARIARLVGTLTPVVNQSYRKLAQSLDEAASVFLVIMGEAIANLGIGGGRFLLQVPSSELQVRRDTVIYALRNLTGATQEAYSPNEWPRGLDAYRRLFNFLDTQGQGELRSLLVENELARIMDTLIHRAAHGSADGLRALGATAQLDLERFRRLVILGSRLDVTSGTVIAQENSIDARISSPPLAAFLDALQLFIDAFGTSETGTSGGYRLLRIARPPILFYGLYGSSGLDDAEQRLQQIVLHRTILADQLDNFIYTQSGSPVEVAKIQILLDKLLYDVDRSIDLYSVGTDVSGFGETEQRAGAYHYMIRAFLERPTFREFISVTSGSRILPTSLGNTLIKLRDQLVPDITFTGRPESFNEGFELRNTGLNRDFEGSFRTVASQELLIQWDTEKRWKNLVRSLAPNAIPYDSTTNSIFGTVTTLISSAIQLLTGSDEPLTDEPFRSSDLISLPPQYETALFDIANRLNGNQDD